MLETLPKAPLKQKRRRVLLTSDYLTLSSGGAPSLFQGCSISMVPGMGVKPLAPFPQRHFSSRSGTTGQKQNWVQIFKFMLHNFGICVITSWVQSSLIYSPIFLFFPWSNVAKPVSGELYQSLKAGWGSHGFRVLGHHKDCGQQVEYREWIRYYPNHQNQLKGWNFCVFLNHFNF